jgi:hypothetical protein
MRLAAAAALVLLAPFVMGMARCVAFAPPTTLGSRDGARLTDAPAGAARVGITVLPTPVTVATDVGYRYRVTPDMELDGSVYAAALGNVGFGAARAGVRFRLFESSLLAVSVSPGVAYVHSVVAGEGSWADGIGLDYGLAGSVRLWGTGRAAVDVVVGFRAQGVYAHGRYLDDGAVVVRYDDAKVYLFPAAGLRLQFLPGVALAAEASWWVQYDLKGVELAGTAVPFIGVGLEMVPWLEE